MIPDMRRPSLISAACLFLLAAGRIFAGENSGNGLPAVIHDRDGVTLVRERPISTSPPVAAITTGELFRFTPRDTRGWYPVTLANGVRGWIHHSCIRLSFTPEDLPTPACADEGSHALLSWSRRHGVDYFAMMHAAARGGIDALSGILAAEDADGEMTPAHFRTLAILLHLRGDGSIARLLFSQPLDYQLTVRRSFMKAVELGCFAPFPGVDYLRRRFPSTWSALFRRVITAWEAPDGRHAVRKVFSSPYPDGDSHVVKAEVVDVRTCKPVYDFTEADTGRGENREGSVLWAPDSRAFAHTCRDIPPARGCSGEWVERTLTTVHRLRNGRFEPVAIHPDTAFPRDPDIPPSATVASSRMEATAWTGPGHLRMRQVDTLVSSGDTFERVRTWTLAIVDGSIRDAVETWTSGERNPAPIIGSTGPEAAPPQ